MIIIIIRIRIRITGKFVSHRPLGSATSDKDLRPCPRPDSPNTCTKGKMVLSLVTFTVT